MNTTSDFNAATEDFKRGGWIVSLLGGLGMLARMLITDQKSSAIIWVRKISAAGIVGVIVYFALHGIDISGLYKALILSFSGMASPEVIELIITKAKNANPPPKKPRPKPKTKRKRS